MRTHTRTFARTHARTHTPHLTPSHAEKIVRAGVPELKRTYSSVHGNEKIGTGHARSTSSSPQVWVRVLARAWVTFDVSFSARARVGIRERLQLQLRVRISTSTDTNTNPDAQPLIKR